MEIFFHAPPYIFMTPITFKIPEIFFYIFLYLVGDSLKTLDYRSRRYFQFENILEFYNPK